MKPKFLVLKLKNIAFIVAALAVSILTIVFSLNAIVRANVGASAEADDRARLAIIIDDFGQARAGVDIMIGIDRKLTLAVMPFLEFSERDMEKAAEGGHEVIIHIPLQYGYNDKQDWVGENAVKVIDSDEAVRNKISSFVDSLPKAVGANIHMGSLGSTDKRVMTVVMQTLKERGLYFVDSKTSAGSVCSAVSKEVGISYGENGIFLENHGKDDESIKKQLMKAAALAKKTGAAIAIGHVGAESGKVTAEVIRDNIGQIEAMGVELVYASEIVK